MNGANNSPQQGPITGQEPTPNAKSAEGPQESPSQSTDQLQDAYPLGSLERRILKTVDTIQDHQMQADLILAAKETLEDLADSAVAVRTLHEEGVTTPDETEALLRMVRTSTLDKFDLTDAQQARPEGRQGGNSAPHQ